MTVQFLELKTLTDEMIERLRGDIKRRITWNVKQHKFLSKMETPLPYMDITFQARIKGYEQSVRKYRNDLIAISDYLNNKIAA